MSRRRGVHTRPVVGLVAAVLVLAGCGGGDASEGAEPEAAAVPSEAAAVEEPSVAAAGEPSERSSSATIEGDVTVVLGEWIVEPTPTSIEADGVTFVADNQGGKAHEVVVVRADDPADLPTDADGAVDEAQIAEEDFVGEIEEFPNGEQRTATFDLEAGTYVLFCNVTETLADGEVESHFAEGMSTTFTVE